MSRRGSSGDVGRGARGRGATCAAGHELGSIRRPPPGRVARSIAAPGSTRSGGGKSPPAASSAASTPAPACMQHGSKVHKLLQGG